MQWLLVHFGAIAFIHAKVSAGVPMNAFAPYVQMPTQWKRQHFGIIRKIVLAFCNCWVSGIPKVCKSHFKNYVGVLVKSMRSRLPVLNAFLLPISCVTLGGYWTSVWLFPLCKMGVIIVPTSLNQLISLIVNPSVGNDKTLLPSWLII